MNSMSTRELRITMPPRAIMPIMLVAVKKDRVGKAPHGFAGDQVQQPEAGHGADKGEGMAIMISSGMKKEPVCTISRM
jgi:hypothetical protein